MNTDQSAPGADGENPLGFDPLTWPLALQETQIKGTQ